MYTFYMNTPIHTNVKTEKCVSCKYKCKVLNTYCICLPHSLHKRLLLLFPIECLNLCRKHKSGYNVSISVSGTIVRMEGHWWSVCGTTVMKTLIEFRARAWHWHCWWLMAHVFLSRWRCLYQTLRLLWGGGCSSWARLGALNSDVPFPVYCQPHSVPHQQAQCPASVLLDNSGQHAGGGSELHEVCQNKLDNISMFAGGMTELDAITMQRNQQQQQNQHQKNNRKGTAKVLTMNSCAKWYAEVLCRVLGRSL